MAKTITGTVVSDKSDKTIVISVVARKTHPLYKKQYTVSTKFMAHDENNDCKVGDKVVIEETRPLSARKRYALKEIVEKAKLTEKDLGAIDKSAASEQEKVLNTEEKQLAKQKAREEKKKTAEAEERKQEAEAEEKGS